MSKEIMKKFWNLMLVALVALGAVACAESDEYINAMEEEGLSFYAEVADDSRATIEEDGSGWKTTWEEGDALKVNDYTFTFDGTKFSCKANGVNSIVGQEVTISGEYGDSKSGKAALSIKSKTVTFESEMSVTLESNLSFFHYTYSGAKDVTFTLSNALFKVGDEATTTITSNGTGEQFIAFYPTGESVTLTYYIDGVKYKEATKAFTTAMVYNLKDLTPTYKVYVLPQPKSSISKWSKYNYYTWVDGGVGLDWPGEDITANTEVVNGYTYYVFNYPAAYTDKTVNAIVNNGTTQTDDIALGVLEKNYYLVVNTTSDWDIYTTAPAAGSVEEAIVVEDPKPDTVSVYLSTTWDWGTFKLYAWGGSGDWGNFDNWPGVTRYTQVIGGVTYNAWDIPASCVGKTGTQMIVNGTNGSQTADFPITFTAGKDVFITLEWLGVSNGSVKIVDSPYTE